MEAIFYTFIIVWVFTVIFTIVYAVDKGYNGFLAFLLGLFIPLLGSLIVIALLPNKKEMDLAIAKIKRIASKEESTAQPTRKCKKCGKEVTGGYTACPHCGSTDLGDAIDDWLCKKCGKTNQNTALFCYSCGEKKFIGGHLCFVQNAGQN